MHTPTHSLIQTSPFSYLVKEVSPRLPDVDGQQVSLVEQHQRGLAGMQIVGVAL